MASRIPTLWMVSFFWLTAFADPATASDPPPEKGPAPEKDYLVDSATVERIMEAAVRNIARRYNLNEAQAKATDELMKREVRRFLKEHENEVWPAIRGLLNAQFGARPPDDPAETKRLGELARPLARLAKEAIFDANDEWRDILTAEQKQMHDFDLAEMEKTFGQIDKNFAAWEKGERMEAPLFPPAPPPGTSPPTPPRPTKPGLPPTEDRFIALGILDTIVEEFIKEYELDEGQITAARSILAEFKNKATDFKDAKKEEFAKIDAEREKAREQRDAEGIKQATAAHKKLLEPFYALVKKMREERLMGLLTSTQIERHAERQKPDEPKPKVGKATTKTPPKTETPAKAETPPPNAKLDEGESQTKEDKG